MLYRSPLVRWFFAIIAVLAGSLLTFGDEAKWRSTPSLHWLAQAPIPLEAWGVAVITYGLLLLPEKTRPAGYFVGGLLWLIFTVSLLATVNTTGPKSALAIAAFLDVTVFHFFSIRIAWATRFAR